MKINYLNVYRSFCGLVLLWAITTLISHIGESFSTVNAFGEPLETYEILTRRLHWFLDHLIPVITWSLIVFVPIKSINFVLRNSDFELVKFGEEPRNETEDKFSNLFLFRAIYTLIFMWSITNTYTHYFGAFVTSSPFGEITFWNRIENASHWILDHVIPTITWFVFIYFPTGFIQLILRNSEYDVVQYKQ